MTMRTELVKIAAYAIKRKEIGREPDSIESSHVYLGADIVDALLDALSEPSEEMIDAACETEGMKQVNAAITLAFVHGHRITSEPSPFVQGWQAALKAIKDESPRSEPGAS